MKEWIVLAIIIGGIAMGVREKPENPIWAWLTVFIVAPLVYAYL